MESEKAKDYLLGYILAFWTVCVAAILPRLTLPLYSPNFYTCAASAKLVRDQSIGLKRELHAAILIASIKSLVYSRISAGSIFCLYRTTHISSCVYVNYLGIGYGSEKGLVHEKKDTVQYST